MRTILFRFFLSELDSPCSRLLCPRRGSSRPFSLSPDRPQLDARTFYTRGLAHLELRLPSRNELCRFPLKPLEHKVEHLLRSIRVEDHGIKDVRLLSPDGARISNSDSIDSLFSRDFVIEVNDRQILVRACQERSTSESAEDMKEVRHLVSKMFLELHSEDQLLLREKEMTSRLHDLREQIAPMEKMKGELQAQASKRIRRLTWLGLGAMGLQFGLLSRLTWWEYSWDIMEPVTYFIGQGYLIMMFAYYVLTRQEYLYTNFFNRLFLKKFYKHAAKENFEVERYNSLCDEIFFLERELKRLQDPLSKGLPLQQSRLMS